MNPSTDFGALIKRLEAQGFTVTIRHERRVPIRCEESLSPEYFVGTQKDIREYTALHPDAVIGPLDPGWGATTVSIGDHRGEVPGVQVIPMVNGHCSTARGDTFNRKLGLAIAFGRALKSAGE